MKTIVLGENKSIKTNLYIMTDGTIRLVRRWKISGSKDVVQLSPDEAEILKKHLVEGY